MKLDLTDYPITDNHCHPFPLEREPESFERAMCIGLYPVKNEDMRNTVYFQMMINEMKRFFGMPQNASADEVIARRNKEAVNNRAEYVKALIKDAGYTRLLVDFGYPIGQKRDKSSYLKQKELEDFAECTADTEVYAINRIEWIANALIDDYVSFEDFKRLLVENTVDMIKSRRLIALKSVIAYYTGLEVKILPDDEVERAYVRLLENRKDEAAEKIVRDYCFMKACEICAQLDIPLQVHTGIGDSPDCNLLKVNPCLLHDAINDPRGRKAKLMLIHGGYPYLEELGLLLNHYSNLYCDISSMIPYAGYAAESKLKNLFEMAPLNKVCFGTDGAGIPEHMWFGAVQGKRALAAVLNDLIEEKYITYEFATEAAANILNYNVEKIYNL